jgi:hypothetical protein
MAERIPTSRVLRALLDQTTTERVSLGWLIGRLGERSFGIILLLLALLAFIPGVSPVAGILLTIPAFQMIRAHSAPVFPRRLACRHFETRRLFAVIRRAVPLLRYLERFIYPRWTTPFEATRRLVGGVVLLLSLTLFVPVPLSNIPPAALISLIAFAYLEEDGALLGLALVAAFILSVVVISGTIWGLTALGTAKRQTPLIPG